MEETINDSIKRPFEEPPIVVIFFPGDHTLCKEKEGAGNLNVPACQEECK